jgi:pyruvate/2-oxoglutarate/acetoin dehydrogenase E1 component/TPP-dependent pyruvate/acetoin dehydrogenase alpha subunit
VLASHERPADGAGAELSRDRVLAEYRIGFASRQASLVGRTEVLTGKAKFGIFGDGKEVPQLALAHALRPGDFRAGYYRDQTVMLALGVITLEQLFAQLYADPDPEREPCSAGRQMNAHFASTLVTEDGSWVDQLAGFNSSADLSPTAAQMPRLVGLAYASRLYREIPALQGRSRFSSNGDEIAFGTIGNASCAEGIFWEAVNAVGVLRAPMLLSIWDDDYGISVPNELQLTKGDLSELLAGFRRAPGGRDGFDLYTVRGWDYPALCETYLRAAEIVRSEHVPAILHVIELTQPQGHSTSGSHERYKSVERLRWEQEHDGLRRMRQWIEAEGLADGAELDGLEQQEKERVRQAQRSAWAAFQAPIREERDEVLELLAGLSEQATDREELDRISKALSRHQTVQRRQVLAAVHEALVASRDQRTAARTELAAWKRRQQSPNQERYSSHLHDETSRSALAVSGVAPEYAADTPEVNGFEVLGAYFDLAFSRRPELVAFGEDVGRLGDVNQGMAGLQEKYGPLRVSDTGIREATIVGQGIGMALRGLRPIAEIQYLDYVLYALQILSDDLASLLYRTRGKQRAPLIVRTRGHRLEGIWHSGSPMAGLLGLLRGIWLCVPRDMTRAAGMYNTLLASEEPGIVVEVLNGYRLKERLPSNLGELTIPLGAPEVLRPGGDLTMVTYGATCRICLEAAALLARAGVEAEVIDVQTLLPFDRPGRITESLRKTGRILFVDEDVPGGATAYMMRQVLEEQKGFWWLDAEPRTVSAKAHRPAYGSDGDYFSKPNREEIFDAAYGLLHDADPRRFPAI